MYVVYKTVIKIPNFSSFNSINMDDQTVGTISLLSLLILNQCEQCNNTIVNSWAIRKKSFRLWIHTKY